MAAKHKQAGALESKADEIGSDFLSEAPDDLNLVPSFQAAQAAKLKEQLLEPTLGEADKDSALTPSFNPKEFLKTVPNLPGCYRMYNARNEVIYVGKAKDLKKRLSSYFLKEQNAKTSALVSHIAHIEFTITFSETEALILENELIKKYQPHYNILLRDDKSYPYLLLTTKHQHPGIYFHRGPQRKAGSYFGPFPDSSAVKDSLKLMQKLFPIRQCEDTVYAHRSRPCLMAQIGKCLAPCVPMSKEQELHYQEQVELIKLFLQGRNQELLSTVVAKMEAHAQAMEFEQAALLRDQLTTLRKVQESNSIISGIEYPVDIIGCAYQGDLACIHVLFVRNGRIFGSRSFYPKLSEQVHSPASLVLSFLCQFYLNEAHPNLIPDEVVLPLESSLLSGQKESELGASSANNLSCASHEIEQDLPELESLQGLGSIDSASALVIEDREHSLAQAKAFIGEIKCKASIETKEPNTCSDRMLTIEGRAEDTTAMLSPSATGVGAIGAGVSLGEEVSWDRAGELIGDSGQFEDVAVLQSALVQRFDKQVRFVSKVRSAKKKYLELAMKNAQVALESKLSSAATAHKRMQELEKLLGLSEITRMECYDISHTMGELTVASCVVFNRDGPDSSRYRRYNIEGITPGDDFAAMHQVLQRRFKDPDSSECPQLIFIDGGAGQLKQAEEVLSARFAHAHSAMPMIVGVAKGEGRKEGLETLIKAFSHERINLPLSSPALQLVLHIRDEAHRFAITGHRARRAKERRTSKLEAIAGVGPKRRQALLKHLGGMQEVMRASVLELSKVPGISKALAQLIYDELHA